MQQETNLPNKVRGPSPSRVPNRSVSTTAPNRIENVELFSINSAIVKQGVGPGVPITGAFVGCFEGDDEGCLDGPAVGLCEGCVI